MTLAELKSECVKAETNFIAIARAHGYTNAPWDFYRALDKGERVPDEVMQAHENNFAATRAFYKARDGERGFLGARGL